MKSKICPYVQNQQSLEEKYEYTEEGQVLKFNQKINKGNAECIRDGCAVWNEAENKCEYYRNM